VDLLVVAVVLGAALAHASWNALLRGRSGDPHAASTGLSLVWALLGGPLLPLCDPLPAAAWPPLLASVAIHVVYFSLLTLAYRTGELGVVYPVARGLPPVLVAAGTWLFLDEGLDREGVLGIALVAAGVLALGAGRLGTPRAMLAAAGAACCTALYTLLDGLGTRASDPAVYVLHLVAIQGSVFAGGALLLGGRPLAREVWARRSTAVASGLLSAAGYAAALWAMTRAPIASVAALRETSVLFAALLGALVLGEPLGQRRVLAAALVALGVVLVR
jgi:drug/metabolite transporter (DMT)-like permease